MDNFEEILIKHLKKTGETNKRKIARDLGVSYAYIMKTFQILRRLGRIQEVKTYRIK